MDKPQSPYIVASVDRALELLILLGNSPRPMGVTEIAKVLGVGKSTAHSLLQTLMGRGFVQQNEHDRYLLGFKLLELGNICADRLDIRSAAHPVMSALAEESGKVVLLAVLSRDELIIIDKVEPQLPFLIIPKFDFSRAAHSTAVGKVLLASAPEAVVASVLHRGFAQFTPYTLTDTEELNAELRQVQELGYAVGCDETIEGLTCAAVPIYNTDKRVIAALSVSSATSLMGPTDYDDVIATLKHKAAMISQRLGHRADITQHTRRSRNAKTCVQ